MSSANEIQAFLFRTAALNLQVDEMRAAGQLADEGSSAIDPGALSEFSFVIRTQAATMSRVYELLFCFENSVRELIEQRLKAGFGVDGWWTQGVPESIRNKGDKLAEKERKTPWHGPRGGTRLSYVDFPELGKIIVERWQQFEDLLGSESWVENLFDEMNNSRRAIAHTGVLDPYDAERLQGRVRDWLRVVG